MSSQLRFSMPQQALAHNLSQHRLAGHMHKNPLRLPSQPPHPCQTISGSGTTPCQLMPCTPNTALLTPWPHTLRHRQDNTSSADSELRRQPLLQTLLRPGKPCSPPRPPPATLPLDSSHNQPHHALLTRYWRWRRAERCTVQNLKNWYDDTAGGNKPLEKPFMR